MKQMPFIDLEAQYLILKDQINIRIQSVLDHGQYIMGPEIGELEESLQEFTGADYCITVSSGTDALLISLMALGIGPGDEVITTPFSFISIAEVVVLLGAKPVFVDIEPDTCNINANLIESEITDKTKAIVPVSLYGQPSDMAEINAIADTYGGLPVVEDAAQSFGAMYKSYKSCNLSTIGCTSFFPSKPLGCYGDGGAIFTNDANIARACREIRVHGQNQRYRHNRVGVGGRMDTIQGAILLEKLSVFDNEIERRFAVGKLYDELFSELNISTITVRSDRTSVFGQYTAFSEDRDEICRRLNVAGIPTAIHYPLAINKQFPYMHFNSSNSTPVADQKSETVFSVPMHLYSSENEMHNMMNAIKIAIS